MAKTIIEELIVEFGLDDSKLQAQARTADDRFKKTKEGLRKGGDEIERGVKRQGAAFGGLRRELVGLFALFTAGAGLKQFVQNTVRSDAAVGRISKQIGVATEELSAWQGVLRRNGGTAEAATSALGTMTSAYEEFIATGRTSLPYLQLLGAQGFRLDHLKNPTEALLKISEIFSKMDPKKAAFIGKNLGFDEATINLLLKGRTALSAQLAEQRKIAVVSDANAKTAERWNNAWSSLIQRSEDLGRQLMANLAPAVEAVTRWLDKLATWAQDNRELVAAFFTGLIAVLGWVSRGAVIAAASVAGLVAAVGLLIAGFTKMVDENPALKASIDELGGAVKELWDSLVNFASYVASSPIGKGLAELFRPGGYVAAGLTLTINALTHGLKALSAALRRDWKTAAAEAKEAWRFLNMPIRSAMTAPGSPAAAVAAETAPAAGNQGGTHRGGKATNLIKGFEGFRETAYWDKNAYRAGYGSDTVTDPTTGRVSRVTSTTKVTRAQADADLKRRLEKEFLPKVMRSVGDAWSKLDADAQAALLSVTYNYGSLPKDVAAAAKTGDRAAIAAAVKNLRSHNGGVNANRRTAEANLIAGGAPANQNNPISQTAALPAGVRGLSSSAGAISNSYNKTTFQIDKIEVVTQATDAKGIARDLGPAINKRMYVTQANRGLG